MFVHLNKVYCIGQVKQGIFKLFVVKRLQTVFPFKKICNSVSAFFLILAVLRGITKFLLTVSVHSPNFRVVGSSVSARVRKTSMFSLSRGIQKCHEVLWASVFQPENGRFCRSTRKSWFVHSTLIPHPALTVCAEWCLKSTSCRRNREYMSKFIEWRSPGWTNDFPGTKLGVSGNSAMFFKWRNPFLYHFLSLRIHFPYWYLFLGCQ